MAKQGDWGETKTLLRILWEFKNVLDFFLLDGIPRGAPTLTFLKLSMIVFYHF